MGLQPNLAIIRILRSSLQSSESRDQDQETARCNRAFVQTALFTRKSAFDGIFSPKTICSVVRAAIALVLCWETIPLVPNTKKEPERLDYYNLEVPFVLPSQVPFCLQSMDILDCFVQFMPKYD